MRRPDCPRFASLPRPRVPPWGSRAQPTVGSGAGKAPFGARGGAPRLCAHPPSTGTDPEGRSAALRDGWATRPWGSSGLNACDCRALPHAHAQHAHNSAHTHTHGGTRSRHSPQSPPFPAPPSALQPPARPAPRMRVCRLRLRPGSGSAAGSRAGSAVRERGRAVPCRAVPGAAPSCGCGDSVTADSCYPPGLPGACGRCGRQVWGLSAVETRRRLVRRWRVGGGFSSEGVRLGSGAAGGAGPARLRRCERSVHMPLPRQLHAEAFVPLPTALPNSGDSRGFLGHNEPLLRSSAEGNGHACYGAKEKGAVL